MIDPDKAPALAFCFIQLYRSTQRGRQGEAELWKLAVLALLEGDGRRVA